MRETRETSEIVIVSNRLPVHQVRHGRRKVWESSPGGLVSALRPILRELSCTWVGWAETIEESPAPFMHEGIRNVPIPLSEAEAHAFYEGFSNRILWPLYHDAIRPPDYNQAWWQPYLEVNQRFAEGAAKWVEPGGIVWVHDYHLQMVPAIVRQLRPDVRIGFFLHIPFPPQELFAQLPWRREILQGLLGADVVGFQTRVGAQNFAQVSRRFADATGEDHLLQFQGRDILVDSFPISVDVAHFESCVADPEILERAADYRGRLAKSRKVMLGLDRLDYTKGIDIRLKAFQELLRSGKVSRNDVVLVQIAIPSREHVEEYKQLRVEVERLVGEINGEFADLGHTPLQYLHKSIPTCDLIALYLTADVMVVTPLRDGMNLVAKEYVACRTNDDGVLILSEFTGAARELTSAVLVNPHDIDGLVEAMHRALTMSPLEQSVRMQSLRKIIHDNDVHHWADSFLQSLAYERIR